MKEEIHKACLWTALFSSPLSAFSIPNEFALNKCCILISSVCRKRSNSFTFADCFIIPFSNSNMKWLNLMRISKILEEFGQFFHICIWFRILIFFPRPILQHYLIVYWIKYGWWWCCYCGRHYRSMPEQKRDEFIESFICNVKSTYNWDCMIRLLHWCLSALTRIMKMCSAWGAITYRNSTLWTQMKPIKTSRRQRERDRMREKRSQWKLSDRWISKRIDHTEVMVTKKNVSSNRKWKLQSERPSSTQQQKREKLGF